MIKLITVRTDRGVNSPLFAWGKEIITKIHARWKKISWFILNRCTFCGGEVEDWSEKYGFCIKCGRRDG